ncbi:hypothetical protein [Quatrionicoccus australiensis]|uniref:hypothetical protein n=1 Tax=Quatrionicoccus australiensis TaxID=138118 RepID=UPI001CF99CBF|nr:hypothetical protein [Quatrionicoccus australiensis]MCB4359607.1 hypothetical protein [Quatrionicoccus australiensis]
MKLTYKTIQRWFAENASACTLPEIDTLQFLLDAARDKAEVKAQRINDAIAAAEVAAKEAGLSLHEMIQGKRTPTKNRSPLLRKPYLNPFDASSPLYALSTKRHGHSLPDWADALVKQGWTLDELHYKNHAKALEKRGITPLYDAEQRYSRLAAIVAMSK